MAPPPIVWQPEQRVVNFSAHDAGLHIRGVQHQSFQRLMRVGLRFSYTPCVGDEIGMCAVGENCGIARDRSQRLRFSAPITGLLQQFARTRRLGIGIFSIHDSARYLQRIVLNPVTKLADHHDFPLGRDRHDIDPFVRLDDVEGVPGRSAAEVVAIFPHAENSRVVGDFSASVVPQVFHTRIFLPVTEMRGETECPKNGFQFQA